MGFLQRNRLIAALSGALVVVEAKEKSGTMFLDPCCKSGVFLREIAKRLNKGLEAHLPNREVPNVPEQGLSGASSASFLHPLTDFHTNYNKN